MALKKIILFKGISAEYLTITSMNWRNSMGNTHVTLSLFANAASRSENLNNALDSQEFLVWGEATLAEAYVKIKESRMVDEIEENWFATAEDV